MRIPTELPTTHLPCTTSTFAFLPSVAALLAGLLASMTLAAAVTAQTNTLYVDTDATGTNDGSSWTNAFTDFQDALAIATGSNEIWIAEGTYKPGTSRDDSFTITGDQDGLKIYGGFQSGDGFSDRDPSAHPVVLSGDIGVSGDVSDNSYHVLVFDGGNGLGTDVSANVTRATVLSGVTVTGGTAFTNPGGGSYCDGEGTGNECSPVLERVTFIGNSASRNNGGAIFNNGSNGGISSPSISNATFRDNSAEFGGAIANFGTKGGTSSPQITDVTFVDNSASWDGGAIANFASDGGNSSPLITNSMFEDNGARFAGGAIDNDSFDDGVVNPQINNTSFVRNSASFGGAINSGARRGISSPQITNAVFRDNSAGQRGGAIHNVSSFSGISNPKITGVSFNGNSSLDGGAIYNWGNGGTSSPWITNSTFTGNSAADGGGAIFNAGSTNIRVTNNTLTGNSAETSGGGIYNVGSTFEITNTVLWANTASKLGNEIYNQGSGTTLILSHTLIEGGLSGISENNGSSTIDDGGNLDADPQFADPSDPDGPDNIFATADDGLRLTSGSPALDAGTNDALDTDENGTRDIITDITGGPRVVDNDADSGTPAVVDLGAYEAGSDIQIPVELTGFDGHIFDDGAVLLTWKTASETSNAGFRVQRRVGDATGRATEGADPPAGESGAWTEVGFVEGAGTTSEPTAYRFTDAALPYEAETLTYRLEQVDTDGTAHRSDEIVVRRAVDRVELHAAYPNPARAQATLRYAAPKQTEVALRLYDVLGRRVQTLVAGPSTGRAELQLDVSGLPSGTYFLQLQAGAEVKTQRLTVVR